jgi:hypothetical protein
MCAVRLAFVAAIFLGCHHPDPAPPPSTDLVIVSTGLPPRRPLRYASPKGTRTTLELAIDGRLEAGEIQSTSPGLVFTLSIAVDDVMPDGKMKVTSTVQELATRATRDQPGAPRALEQAGELQGLTIAATLSPDGRLADVQPAIGTRKLSDTAKAQLAQLAQALPQLAMPLPTTPVGVGAKWRSARLLAPASALVLTSVTTVDLTAIEGSTASFQMSSEVHGADQTAMQDGVSVDVKGITGTATGHGTIDLATLALEGTISAELHMDMTAAGERTPMTMAFELSTSTVPSPGGASAPAAPPNGGAVPSPD